MALALQLPQRLEAGAELRLAPSVEEAQPPAQRFRQTRAVQALVLAKLPLNQADVLGLVECALDLVLSFDAATLPVAAGLVQKNFWVMGRPSPKTSD